MKTDIQNYASQFSELLAKIKNSRNNAFRQVNATLIQLYWEVGSYIFEQIECSDWGKGVVEELATFISQKELGLKGFNTRNLWRMKQFYGTYKN